MMEITRGMLSNLMRRADKHENYEEAYTELYGTLNCWVRQEGKP